MGHLAARWAYFNSYTMVADTDVQFYWAEFRADGPRHVCLQKDTGILEQDLSESWSVFPIMRSRCERVMTAIRLLSPSPGCGRKAPPPEAFTIASRALRRCGRHFCVALK